LQVQAVENSLMRTGRGIVNITRWVMGEQERPFGIDGFAQLRDTPADTMLRKLCASCHLGHPKTSHRLDAHRRGGGCLACHINAYPTDAHPRLSRKVKDQRCYGCHARSARVSLNYRGLAEVQPSTWQRPGREGLQRLPDGRLTEAKESDVHSRAGLACIDCHTGSGLMGTGKAWNYARQAVDIQCDDCHRNQAERLTLADWPQNLAGYQAVVPFPVGANRTFLATQRLGTPLWHIEVDGERLWLHRKLTGGRLEIPLWSEASHPRAEDEHARLDCAACHSRWAPQCHGCHVQYQTQRRQWDHQAGRPTPGRWKESRWLIRNDLPPLGVTVAGRIRPFVPGMILSMEHPAWEKPRFRRLFAAVSPHTSGAARSCGSCHRSPRALGLGQGRLEKHKGEWRFMPAQPLLIDGLPADAWTGLGGTSEGESIRPGDRPFRASEIKRILETELP
jgi:hypothetical protein